MTSNFPSPTEFFGKWAETGKDEGMEKGHAESVQFMLEIALADRKLPFTFIDAGCGNGWVVRKIKKHPLCRHASGIDGAHQMIEKAVNIDKSGEYVDADLEAWIPEKLVDIVHSMEVLYYLIEPEKFINNLFEKWLNPGGQFIFGIDHYLENPPAVNWPEECGVFMNTLSTEMWEGFMLSAGFEKNQTFLVGAKNDWQGTLVISGIKPV